MKHPLLFISMIITALILSGCSPSLNVLSYRYRLETAQTSTAPVEPMTPSERKEVEELSSEFAQKYYTYNLENYVEVNNELLSLMTSEYQSTFKQLTADGLLAAKAVNAESEVESVQVSEVDKLSSNLANVKLIFNAKVSTNGQTTRNQYSTKLGLLKKDEHWKINAILSEQPVKFFELKKLL